MRAGGARAHPPLCLHAPRATLSPLPRCRRAKALDLESFSPDKLAGGLNVFLMATYGEGEPTDNSVDFTRWLKAAPAGCLAGAVRFTVFGLGNRQYEHYNAMGKLVDTRLAELGAARVYRHGEGDDEGNMEEESVALCGREGGEPATGNY